MVFSKPPAGGRVLAGNQKKGECLAHLFLCAGKWKMNKRYYWLKLPEDFFRDKAVKRLRKLAGGDTYTIIYLKMLLQSIKTEGKFYFTGIEEDIGEEIALELDEEPDNVKVVLQFLVKAGLATVGEDEVMMKNLPKMIGSESASAERVRNHRERQKLLQCNTDVTGSNNGVTSGNTNVRVGNVEIDIDRDIEIDKEIDIDRDIERESVCFNNPPPSSPSVFTPPTLDEVIAFCKKYAPYVDPLRFYNEYKSKGWMINGNLMVDWEARARIWNREDKLRKGPM